MQEKIYKSKISEYKNLLEISQKRSRIIAYLRGFVFFAGIFLAIYLKSFSISAMFGGIVFSLVIFLFLVRKNYLLSRKINFQKTYLKINEDELKVLSGDFSNFHEGDEFIDAKHSFSYDLDIFGKASIFQYLNRTCSSSGKIQLAENLTNIEQNRKTILERQKAVEELSKLIDLRQKFNATGQVYSSKDEDENSKENKIKKAVLKWANRYLDFANNKSFKLLITVFSIFTISLIFLSIINILPSIYFVLAGVIQLMFTGAFLKKINNEHAKLSEILKQIIKLKELIYIVENHDFESEYLKNLQEKFKINKKTASTELKTLNSVLKAFDFRLNFIFAFLANMFLMWDLHIVFHLEKLKRNLKDSIGNWFDIIGEFDSLMSLANFAYNNSDFVFPKISDNDFTLETKLLGHPLILKENRVANDFSISDLHKINIITGANMAGKSTFLRTVGLNLILASAGSKVCAKSYIFSPIDIYTSIRNDDSLEKNESYFYAELMRIKTMIDRLKTDENLFIILDEILRGTNSKDKHTGSRKLIEKLITYKASGLIATHDIQLGNLIEKYPENIENKRFEVEISNDKLTFDYKLLSGISQNLNATFLMEKYLN